MLSSTEELHQRIAELEEALRSVQPAHPALEHSVHSRTEVLRTQIANERRRLPREPHDTISPPGWSTKTSSEGNDLFTREPIATHDSSPIGAMAPHGHLILGPVPGSYRYYGAASSVYLSKKTISSEQSDVINGSPLGESLLRFLGPPLGYSPVHTLEEVLAEHLPPFHEAQRLAGFFFEIFSWMTPVVLPVAWETEYLPSVYPMDGSSDRASAAPQLAAIVFLVLAIGAKMDLNMPRQNMLATRLLTAAKLCLSLDTTHCLHFVRCIVLYGYCIMNGDRDTSLGDTYWPLLRMAMGVVESLGLHRDDSCWDLTPEERLERRVLFWECHTFDVLQSASLGRGQCIAYHAIDCPTVNVDDAGFHSLAWDFTLMWSKINDLQIRVRPPAHSEALEIDRQITAFETKLPPHLAPHVPPSPLDLTEPVRKRLALKRNLLLLFINEARIALHRPWFVQALSSHPHELRESPAKISCLVCLEACRSIVALVRNMVALHGGFIHRRWHFFFHLFSACVCLAAVGIRAPGSSLALIALGELELGVDLFRVTQRDELAVVQRLRDHAEQCIKSGRARDGAGDSEDLDLLGARNRTTKSTIHSGIDISAWFEIPAPATIATLGHHDFAYSLPDPPSQVDPQPQNDSMNDLFGDIDAIGRSPAVIEDFDVQALLASFGLE